VREWCEDDGVIDKEHHQHYSNLSRKSFGSIKGGATPVKDERGPGLDIYVMFWFKCVRSHRSLR